MCYNRAPTLLKLNGQSCGITQACRTKAVNIPIRCCRMQLVHLLFRYSTTTRVGHTIHRDCSSLSGTITAEQLLMYIKRSTTCLASRKDTLAHLQQSALCAIQTFAAICDDRSVFTPALPSCPSCRVAHGFDEGAVNKAAWSDEQDSAVGHSFARCNCIGDALKTAER